MTKLNRIVLKGNEHAENLKAELQTNKDKLVDQKGLIMDEKWSKNKRIEVK